eukprot:Em0266g5a
MPFGLTNAPATFQRLMEEVLSGLHWTTCLVYLDDILIFSATVEDHLVRLRDVLDRLKNAGLKIKPKHGIKTDPEKTRCVADWPTPSNAHELRQFLGLAGYYRRFVKNFAVIAAPLFHLTENHQAWNWTLQCNAAFFKLKESLVTSPVLAYPVFSIGFVVDTDASGEGLGAVLSQNIEGHDHVISYASRTLNKAERKYCATRREMLALVWAIQHFRAYLYGKRFTVRTDHSSLKWLQSFHEPEDYHLRRTIEDQGCVLAVTDSWMPSWTHEELAAYQRQDPDLKQVIKWLETKTFPKCHHLVMQNKILYRQWEDVQGRERTPIPAPCAPMQLDPVERPLQRVAMDILGPLPETEKGNKYILVIGDYFTKWKEAYPLPNMEAMTVARHLVSEFMCRFGVPEQLHSDQGRNFESGVIKGICELLQEDEEVCEHLKKAMQNAYKSIRDEAWKEMQHQKNVYDERQNERQCYQKGDFVWLHCPAVPRGHSPKFHRPWQGPYEVEEKLGDVVYRIRKNRQAKQLTVHFNRLKPYTQPVMGHPTGETIEEQRKPEGRRGEPVNREDYLDEEMFIVTSEPATCCNL